MKIMIPLTLYSLIGSVCDFNCVSLISIFWILFTVLYHCENFECCFVVCVPSENTYFFWTLIFRIMYIIVVICIEFNVILFFVKFFFKKNLFIIELVSCNKRRFNKSLGSGQYVTNCNLMKGGFGNMSFS